jgi:hypothetical protein
MNLSVGSIILRLQSARNAYDDTRQKELFCLEIREQFFVLG